jgi:hypothetical protein
VPVYQSLKLVSSTSFAFCPSISSPERKEYSHDA